MKSVLCLSLGAAAALLGCADASLAPKRIRLTQEILQIEVLQTLTCPPTNSVHILAGRGACDTPLDPVITRQGQTVSIELPVSSSREVCIARLDGYELTVVLPVDLPPGTYNVTAVAEFGSKSVTVGVADCR